ncbi:complement C3-like isoform X2 [Lampetra planeri]
MAAHALGLLLLLMSVGTSVTQDPMVLLSVPSVILIGSDVNVLVDARGLTEDVRVVVRAEEFLTKKQLATQTITLTQLDPAIATLKNADGVIVERQIKTIKSTDEGIVDGTSFTIPAISKHGTWKIFARMSGAPNINSSAEFDVREYILPTFEVKINPKQRVFHINDEEFVVDITANYFNQELVSGTAYVRYFLENGDVPKLVDSSSTTLVAGEGISILKKEKLLKLFPNTKGLLAFSLTIKATVLSSQAAETEEAELVGIKIVESRYQITATKTSRYFKAELPYFIQVEVRNADGSPSKEVDVVAKVQVGSNTINPQKMRTDSNGLTSFTVTPPNVNQLTVTVRTDERHPPNEQGELVYTAQKYASASYMHIDVARIMRLGETLNVFLTAKTTQLNAVTHFTYMVLTRGVIVKTNRKTKESGGGPSNVRIPITPDMAPRFRFVAYYILPGGEIVADSVTVEVTELCKSQVSLSLKGRPTLEPKAMLTLDLIGEPDARVGLLAVDQAVYAVNRKHRLTQDRVWKAMETFDTGCTAEGGAGAQGVFSDAGLALITSKGFKTPDRSEIGCPKVPSRKRRQLSMLQIRREAEKYTQEFRKCCVDGLKMSPTGQGCEERLKHVTGPKECVDAFLQCCKKAEEYRKSESIGVQTVLRRNDFMELDLMNEDEVNMRSYFPQSWGWNKYKIPANGKHPQIRLQLPDTITTWNMQAISISKTRGVCLADPLLLVSTKDFFIKLHLPYSVKRGEQTEIRVILYNYMEESLTILTEMDIVESICSTSKSGAKPSQKSKVKAKGAMVVSFPIVPLKIGEHQISIRSRVYGRTFGDGVQKVLRVAPEGVRDILSESRIVHVEERDTFFIKNEISSDIVPNSEVLTFISVKGDELAETMANSLDAKSISHLIRIPLGCGEQNMIFMAPTTLTLIYLDSVQEWEKIGLDRRDEAIEFLKQGYSRELSYRKADHSYAAFLATPSSTWLTAFVVKVYSLAKSIIIVDNKELCGPVEWVIKHRQNSDGSYREDAPVYHREMQGGVGGLEGHVSMTAFILIGIQQAQEYCGGTVLNYQQSMNRAVQFLASKVSGLQRMYTIAITAYALALQDPESEAAHSSWKKLESRVTFEPNGRRYWKADEASHGLQMSAISVEATAYGLLTYLRHKDYESARGVVDWLTEQRNYGGGFGSTQSTILALQAMSQYKMDSSSQAPINVQLEITSPKNNFEKKMKITEETRFVQEPHKIPPGGNITVKALGRGTFTLSIMSVFNKVAPSSKSCSTFDLKVTMTEANDGERPQGRLGWFDGKRRRKRDIGDEGGVEAVYRMDLCTRYKPRKGDPSNESGMTIIEVNMLTGFLPDKNDLIQLKDSVDKYISYYEITDSVLIIYLDKVSSTEDYCFAFKIKQMLRSDMIQPVTASVYDYYSPQDKCTRFYNLPGGYVELSPLCQNDLCQCVEVSCPAKKPKFDTSITVLHRQEAACVAGIDYAYVGIVDNRTEVGSFVYYTVNIQTVIKSGQDQAIQPKAIRLFIVTRSCDGRLGMETPRQYLLMGRKGETKDKNDRFQYVLDSSSWVEQWPMDEKCNQPNVQAFCAIKREYEFSMQIQGCSS